MNHKAVCYMMSFGNSGGLRAEPLPTVTKAKRAVMAAQRRVLDAKAELAAAEKEMREAQAIFDAVVRA